MTWEEWLFLEASKETGGEFQMQHLSPVKEIHQDILALCPTQPFLCSFSPTAVAATFRQVWRMWGCGSKVRNRWAFQQEKKSLAETGVSLSYWLLCLPLSTPFFRKEEDSGRETPKKTCLKYPLLKLQTYPSDTCFLRAWSCIQPLTATCSSSPSFSPVTSVAYMGPALEEFRLGFKYSSPTCDSACHFLGRSSSNVSERESVIANLTVVGATFNSCWDQLIALILGDSLMACRWSSCSLSCIEKNSLPITWQLLGTSGMQHKCLLYPVFSVW